MRSLLLVLTMSPLLVNGAAAQTISPDAVFDAPSSSYSQSGHCQCEACQTAESHWTDDFFFNGSVGGSYVDSVERSYGGATYDLGANYWLTGMVSATANFSGNHFSGGSQYLVTVGLQKYANTYAACATGNIGYNFTWSVLYDYYTDTRFNSDITQLRYSLGYALSDRLEVGAFYWDPLEGDDFTFNLGGATALIPFQTFETVGAYVNASFDDVAVSGSVGYIADGVETMVYQLGASTPLSDMASLYANASYQDDPQIWTAQTGISFSFGPGGRATRDRVPGSGFAKYSELEREVQLASAESSADIVRGQPGGNFQFFAASNQPVAIYGEEDLGIFQTLLIGLVGADVSGGLQRQFNERAERERKEAQQKAAKLAAEMNARIFANSSTRQIATVTSNVSNSQLNLRFLGDAALGFVPGAGGAFFKEGDNLPQNGKFLFRDSGGNLFECERDPNGTFFITEGNGQQSAFTCTPVNN